MPLEGAQRKPSDSASATFLAEETKTGEIAIFAQLSATVVDLFHQELCD